MIIVDTNVVSELIRSEPAAAVRRWAGSQRQSEVHTTSITVAEILHGIERLPTGRRQDGLRTTANEVFALFADHVLAFDVDAAAHYAHIIDARDRLGRPIDGFDAQIAAIARTRSATLATRNTKDFERVGIELVDPWHHE